jgi:hypothetical protein
MMYRIRVTLLQTIIWHEHEQEPAFKEFNETVFAARPSLIMALDSRPSSIRVSLSHTRSRGGDC